MQLKINLATRTYLNMRRLNLSIGLLVACLTLGIFFSVKAIATSAGELKRMEKEITAIEGKSQGKVNEQEYQKLLAKIGSANAIIQKKTYRWMQLLDELEKTVPDGVAITSLLPDPQSGALNLTGVATNFAGVRKFVENLEETKFFRDVYLLSQSEAKVGQGQHGTNFVVACKVAFK